MDVSQPERDIHLLTPDKQALSRHCNSVISRGRKARLLEATGLEKQLQYFGYYNVQLAETIVKAHNR